MKHAKKLIVLAMLASVSGCTSPGQIHDYCLVAAPIVGVKDDVYRISDKLLAVIYEHNETYEVLCGDLK